MNNRGVPRYLGQQQVVRRLLVNRMPGPPPVMQPRQPAYMYQQSVPPPQLVVQNAPQPVISYAPRPRFTVNPNSQSVTMGASQFVTRPVAPQHQ